MPADDRRWSAAPCEEQRQRDEEAHVPTLRVPLSDRYGLMVLVPARSFPRVCDAIIRYQWRVFPAAPTAAFAARKRSTARPSVSRPPKSDAYRFAVAESGAPSGNQTRIGCRSPPATGRGSGVRGHQALLALINRNILSFEEELAFEPWVS